MGHLWIALAEILSLGVSKTLERSCFVIWAINQVAFSHEWKHYKPLLLLYKTMAPVLSLRARELDSSQDRGKSTNPALQNSITPYL